MKENSFSIFYLAKVLGPLIRMASTLADRETTKSSQRLTTYVWHLIEDGIWGYDCTRHPRLVDWDRTGATERLHKTVVFLQKMMNFTAGMLLMKPWWIIWRENPRKAWDVQAWAMDRGWVRRS